MKQNISLIILHSLIFLTNACVPVQQSGSLNSNLPTLKYENQPYHPDIATVQLFKLSDQTEVSLNNPTVELGSSERLLLTFDDLSNQQQLYQAKIIHVDKDWKQKSSVLAMNYIDGYNQFAIQNYEYSFDTKLPYIHYSFELPNVKISGNYVVVVYRGNNDQDIVLSERFRVYENKTAIRYKIVPSSQVRNRRNMQEVEFTVMLKGANILNAGSDIFPVVRQNNNWLNAIKLSQPRQIESNELVYNYFDGTLNFPGTNEFRFIDISTVNFKGTNIAQIIKESTPIKMITGNDVNRSNEAYREWQDRNGKFFIGNRERQTDELVNDYIDVTFQLKVAKQEEPIYIVGEFNNWETNGRSKLIYNSNLGIYQTNYLLKQGYYEYLYFTEKAPHYEFEGSYVDTENDYDIAVYYSNQQLRYDQLIGYVKFDSRSARQNK